jgi:hypothetical protein
MLSWNLTDRTTGQLGPNAPFIVLAVMCHPTDGDLRDRMLAPLRRYSADPDAVPSELDIERFERELKLRTNRGAPAGSLLLHLIQLRENGVSVSLNRAIALVRLHLPDWEQLCAPEWTKDAHRDHMPRSRRKLLAVFNDFLSVSHLWAALLYGLQEGRADIWPGSNQTLPRFLAYAEAFAAKGARLRWAGSDRAFTLPSKLRWHFGISEHLRENRPVLALPLNREQLQVLERVLV